MELKLQIILILASLFTFIFVILRIKKHQLNIDDSIIWILWSIVLLVFSIFPGLPNYLSKLLGFESPSNFILTGFIFLVYIMVFFQGIKISELKEKNKKLIQRLSIEKKNEEDEKKRKNK